MAARTRDVEHEPPSAFAPLTVHDAEAMLPVTRPEIAHAQNVTALGLQLDPALSLLEAWAANADNTSNEPPVG